MCKIDENNEMYGFVEGDSNDIFASEDHHNTQLFGTGRRCKKCGNYFMISGFDDPRYICPECKESWRRGFAMISEDDGG